MNNTTERKYEFRELCAKDIPLMTNVIKAIGINEIKAIINEDTIKAVVSAYIGNNNAVEGENSNNNAVDKESKITAMGMTLLPSVFDVAEIILNNLEKCQTALNKLLARTSNLSVEKVENLSLVDYTMMIMDFLKKEEFPDFFKVVSTFFKPEK